MRKRSKVTQEVKDYFGNGKLRDVLKSHSELSEEAIQKIIDAISFVYKI